MIMRLRGYDMEIMIEDNTRVVLCILNKLLYRNIVSKIQYLIDGNGDNDVVIEEDGELLNYDKDVTCLTDYYTIDFETRSIQTNLQKKVEAMLVTNTEDMIDIEVLYKQLIHRFQSSLLDNEIDVVCNLEFDIDDFLKMVNLKIDVQDNFNILEKLYLYIDLHAYFHTKKLLILFNLKNTFTYAEIQDIYKYLEYKKIKWICIENTDYDKLELEMKYVIDEDLVEYPVSK